MELTTDNIRIRLGKTDILRGIDLQARPNQLTGIIGPNGSGKSTLLKCVYRVLQADAGAVYIDGEPLQAMRMKTSARKMAVLAQHSPMTFDFTVQSLVLLGRAPHKKALERDDAADYEKVGAALTAVEMDGYEMRYVSTLSGGERQRVLLARALAQDTPILILDEPTNHLDVKHQLQIMRICKSSGKTVVAAIHDLNVAAMFCDWVYAMKDGCIIAEGRPAELFTGAFIERLFEVPAQVIPDANGRPRIFFEPC